MATITVTPSDSAPPVAQSSDTKACTHCNREKPVGDYIKPGITEPLKTCVACRLGRAAARARNGTKRKRRSRNSGDSPQSRRKTEHSSGDAPSSSSSKRAVQQQHSSSSSLLSSPPSQTSPPPPLPSSANPRTAPPPPTPLSASSESSRARMEVAHFAASLSRLSELVSSATEELEDERLLALTDEINHDWKVDEMATFVDGFLKGAAELGQDRAW